MSGRSHRLNGFSVLNSLQRQTAEFHFERRRTDSHPRHNCHFQASLSLLSQPIGPPLLNTPPPIPKPLCYFISSSATGYSERVDDSTWVVGVRYKTAQGGGGEKESEDWQIKI